MKNYEQCNRPRFGATFLRGVLCLGIITLILPLEALAQERSVMITVAPEETSIAVTPADAGVTAGYKFESASQPIHGALSVTNALITYYPASDFWSIGTDSITVETNEETETPILRVHFVAGRRDGNQFVDGFEAPGPTGYAGFYDSVYDPEGHLGISSIGPVSGDFSLTVNLEQSDSSPAWLSYGEAGTLASVLGGTTGTPGDQDGGAQIRLDTDPNNGGGGGSGPPIGLLEGVNWTYGGVSTFQLQAQIVNGRVQVRAAQFDTAGVSTNTDWHEVGFGHRTVRVEWWTAAHVGATGGLRLWIDYTVVGEITGIGNFDRYVQEVRLGAPVVPLMPIGGYQIDDLKITAGDLNPDVAIRYDDGFEDLDHPLVSGSSSEPGGAGITGNNALQLSRGQMLNDTSPSGEDNFSIRMAVDLSDLWGERDTIELLSAYGNEQMTSEVIAGLRLDLQRKNWALSAVVTDDSGNLIQTNAVPLAGPGPHVIELQWWREHNPNFPNGQLRLWLNGQVVSGLTNFWNGTQSIEAYDLGFGSEVRSTSGTMRIDDIVTWID